MLKRLSITTSLKSLALVAAAAFSFGSAVAQDAYPSRAITMVVPFPPGGVADTVGRPIADAMSRALKQSVVVENRAGAGGGIGFSHVAKAKPDGYTVLMALSSVSVIPEADRILGKAPSYELNQLKPIARITADPTVLVVRSETPWKTYKDFVADMRKNPTKFNYGSSGNYGTMHVPMSSLKPQRNSRLRTSPTPVRALQSLASWAARWMHWLQAPRRL